MKNRLMLQRSSLRAAAMLMVVKNARTAKEFFRYALVGLVSNVIGYVLYLVVTAYWLAPREAVSLLYFVGMLMSFFGNKSITFAYEGSTLRSSIKFIGLYMVGYVLNLAMLFVLVDRMGYAHEIVQAVAIVVVAVFLYVGQKIFVFKAGK